MAFESVDKRDLYRCVSCGNCRSVCPAFEQTGRESKNTRGRILVIRDIYEGNLTDDSVFDSINTCTTCGYCTVACPAGVHPPDLVEGARGGLVAAGKMTPTQMKIRDTVTKYANTLGDSGSRCGWLEGTGLAVPENPKAVYFVGCLDAYRYPETAVNTYTILSKMGVGLLEDENCCASPLLRLGFVNEANDLMKHNIEQIKKSGADTIIAGCAGCYNTLKNNYDLDGIKVVTVSEYLVSHLEDLKKAGLGKLDLKITYHDPCHSGRHNNVFDEPRELIYEIVGKDNLIEMKTIREKSRCCGGGGGVRSGFNDLSLAMAKRRLEDVPSGVDYIVTTCPLCLRNLRDAGGDIPVIDLVELIRMSIEK
ncbi:putative iron-sulfur-binding oxidoreductase FadF [Methanimicrococcus hongohii]|uniref:Iron-sulfur-binding oxidoreductase FadF n=1 Tax=Methanimicrococcus hongohii TaxID=3028295 RepID=A0AA96VBQ1_9EURY|nr:(Fe-S)-binding protein [Methanimicrococcus sp. Hf6]WNY23972.1 putative iron-sulfur-binding oxidoreductase FadF [Methanimicrococcus sp. Hf6]